VIAETVFFHFVAIRLSTMDVTDDIF